MTEEMTERKFTTPTTFPAEYVTRDGKKAVIVARTPDKSYPFIGWYEQRDNNNLNSFWTDGGAADTYWPDGLLDLFDIGQEPQTQVHWANDYGRFPGSDWCDSREEADNNAGSLRIAVIRRELVDGQPPQYFAEGV
jgi:hypothetical protein